MNLMTGILLCTFTSFVFNAQTTISAPTSPPARGTVDFIKYVYNLNDNPPSYWTQSSNFFIVDVDDVTEEAIRKLVDETWDKDLVGKGDDGRNLNQTALSVVNVKRIENPALFSKYNAKRKEILLSRFDCVAPDVGSLTGSRGKVSTTSLLPQKMKDVLYTEINEHYFFHGTKVKYVESISKTGFNLSLAGLGQFGRGIYGAERSTKADQYTDAAGDIQNMLLVRMTLGSVYLCSTNKRRLAIRNTSLPPANDDNGNPETYNSVMSDFKVGNLSVFREFIVYTQAQFYPEYIIEYTRKSSGRQKSKYSHNSQS
ncbi:hypothetical protein Btru_009434 [Bulinus truncatus]|nr:hypothetical protein Btru_009434 [Bulinus truncatus]